ncbi:MAG: PilT/PilU family type 4a pilus ATPase [Elusimicrobiaceae bacterium]|jgi:twitching motility protein PilT|nr:PilT/PilU family type 4a pilus ATPase [Elusimicrobiaceae bacterium]MBT3954607.1 PilT/PilU family type 4a pilus ATPase [Elusimicrobiaceae bacterium]MBT4007915.1 PilT/PilU family type 4a pilus ATPase [Elusimicrobiaceae bacterium]MBT4403159.1 PilT/PilU family type 4a pilus ATPase [Elusimicrobiaceae bacterium]MBT4439929.1 PilT/PilU family type 4a pilus ATPase [Elusimicrobiaceae bacterium]
MALTLTSLLKTVVENEASGLHIRGNSYSYVRINTAIKAIEDSFLSNEQVKKMAMACMGDTEKAVFEEKKSVDFSLDAQDFGRFRFNVFLNSGKYCMAVRYIPYKIPSFEELNLPADTLKKIADNQRGLILVTGMTGSGKSSTLAAMIDHINRTRRGHILTIEDPVEFIHVGEKSIISQINLGKDTPSYKDALRFAMRQDPDVIMIGELRDTETIEAAISAAETGHLVLATVHTINVVQTIGRIIDAFPMNQQAQIRLQLADLLKGVISQRLLPTSNNAMMPALEIMVNNANIKKFIADNKLLEIDKAIEGGDYYGMTTFDDSLVKLYKDGKAKLDIILDYSTNSDMVKLKLKGIRGGADDWENR